MSLYRSKAKHMLFFFFKYVFIWLTAFETYSKNTAILYIYTIIYYTIVYYSILYCSISNIRIQQRLLANDVPGDTHNLQRLTGYQFSSDRYYILCYCQQYISGYDFNHLLNMFQKEFKVTLRMIALFECSSQ